MSRAIIDAVALSPTHDGDMALVVELRFAEGGRSKVQIDPQNVHAVFAKAGVLCADDLVGLPWSVVCVRDPVFFGAAGAPVGSWSAFSSEKKPFRRAS